MEPLTEKDSQQLLEIVCNNIGDTERRTEAWELLKKNLVSPKNQLWYISGNCNLSGIVMEANQMFNKLK